MSVNPPVAAVMHDKTTGARIGTVDRTGRTFRISVICGLNYSVNNTACSGLRSTTGCATRVAITRDAEERGRGVRDGGDRGAQGG